MIARTESIPGAAAEVLSLTEKIEETALWGQGDELQEWDAWAEGGRAEDWEGID